MSEITLRYIPDDIRAKMSDDEFAYVKEGIRLFPVQFAEDIEAAAILIEKSGLAEEEMIAAKQKLEEIAKAKGFGKFGDDLANELNQYVLFTAEVNDIFNIKLDNKIFKLQVVDVKQVD